MPVVTSGLGFRVARTAIFTAVCVTTTALGHALMSHDVPVWALAAASAAVFAGAWRLTARQRGALTVTGCTVATQLALHGLFTLAQHLTPAAPAPTGMTATHAMPGMPGMAGHGMPGMAMGGTHLGGTGSLGMLLAHTVAALVCGVWLWRGEAAVFQLLRSLAAALFAPLRRVLAVPLPGPAARPVRPRDTPPVRRLCGLLLRHVLSRRGPPFASFAR